MSPLPQLAAASTGALGGVMPRWLRTFLVSVFLIFAICAVTLAFYQKAGPELSEPPFSVAQRSELETQRLAQIRHSLEMQRAAEMHQAQEMRHMQEVQIATDMDNLLHRENLGASYLSWGVELKKQFETLVHLCKAVEANDVRCDDPNYIISLADNSSQATSKTATFNRDEAIAEKEKQFKSMKFKYNRPAYLSYGKSNTIVLSIASSDLKIAESTVAQGTGPVHGGEANFSDEVRASLVGDPSQVEIHLSDEPENNNSTEAVTSAANSTWTWYVKPKTFDKITLTLSLYNETEVDGEIIEIPRPVYTDHFDVNATYWDKWSGFLGSFWAGALAFAGAVGGAVTGVIEFLKWRRERKAEKRGETPTPLPQKKRSKKQANPPPSSAMDTPSEAPAHRP